MATERGETSRSVLLIQRARPSDSGNYQCNPSNSRHANVTVHVLNGESITNRKVLLFIAWKSCVALAGQFHTPHLMLWKLEFVSAEKINTRRRGKCHHRQTRNSICRVLITFWQVWLITPKCDREQLIYAFRFIGGICSGKFIAPWKVTFRHLQFPGNYFTQTIIFVS